VGLMLLYTPMVQLLNIFPLIQHAYLLSSYLASSN
jgi:hypothetical protein